ncbi:glycosyltransferase [Enterococcus avium]|uniref:glycosyltransferase n=1 Tax=Enterococcus avium TaxID=33945 RepID=UPI001F562DF7|nr:glycosyltransferase [Enterococcus avium]
MKRVDVCIHENFTRAKYTQEKYHRNIHILHNYPLYYDVQQIPKGKLYELIGVSQDVPIFLYQGGIQEGRGLNNILEAAKYIDDGVFVFIGNGKKKEELKERTKKMNLNGKVIFLDKVPYSKLKLYTADAFLGFQVIQDTCFNHYSASSNKLFEYILSEVPVIGSNLPEISKVLKNEKVGILVNPEIVGELVEAINFLLTNRNEYLNIKKNCQIAKHNYTWNNEQKHLLAIYEEINNSPL